MTYWIFISGVSDVLIHHQVTILLYKILLKANILSIKILSCNFILKSLEPLAKTEKLSKGNVTRFEDLEIRLGDNCHIPSFEKSPTFF